MSEQNKKLEEVLRKHIACLVGVDGSTECFSCGPRCSNCDAIEAILRELQQPEAEREMCPQCGGDGQYYGFGECGKCDGEGTVLCQKPEAKSQPTEKPEPGYIREALCRIRAKTTRAEKPKTEAGELCKDCAKQASCDIANDVQPPCGAFEPKQAEKLREALAKLAHEQWSGWMDYLFSKCEKVGSAQVEIPDWAVKRWMRQANTAYSELSPKEQDSDRTEADKFLAVFQARIEQLKAQLKAADQGNEELVEEGERLNAELADAQKKWAEWMQWCLESRKEVEQLRAAIEKKEQSDAR